MTITKRFISFFMAVLMTFSFLAVSASAATTMGGLNVSYRMDGENVVETIIFSGATMIRTVTPTGTMTIKTIENGSTSTAKVNADYSVYKKIYEAQYGVATTGSEVTGSQYKHRYVGTPGPVTITKQEVVQCRTAAALAKKILGKSSIPAFVAFSVAKYMLGKAVDTMRFCFCRGWCSASPEITAFSSSSLYPAPKVRNRMNRFCRAPLTEVYFPRFSSARRADFSASSSSCANGFATSISAACFCCSRFCRTFSASAMRSAKLSMALSRRMILPRASSPSDTG